MAAANRLLGNHRSRRIPLVGIREGEMTMSAITIFQQLQRLRQQPPKPVQYRYANRVHRVACSIDLWQPAFAFFGVESKADIRERRGTKVENFSALDWPVVDNNCCGCVLGRNTL